MSLSLLWPYIQNACLTGSSGLKYTWDTQGPSTPYLTHSPPLSLDVQKLSLPFVEIQPQKTPFLSSHALSSFISSILKDTSQLINSSLFPESESPIYVDLNSWSLRGRPEHRKMWGSGRCNQRADEEMGATLTPNLSDDSSAATVCWP